MKYELLSRILESSREFRLFAKALTTPYGKDTFRPSLAEGLSDGAFELFVLTIASSETAKKAHRGRMLVICREEKEAASLAEFLNWADCPASFYPAKDFNFNNITASHDVEHERLSVLTSLLMTDAPLVVCTTAEAALQATLPEDALSDSSVAIDSSSSIDLEALIKSLSEAGYARVGLVDGIGQFAVRGGIVDIFPPGDMPLRIELFGDEIDRMCYFDVMTQRAVEDTDSAVIPPVKESLLSPAAEEKIKKAVSKLIDRCSDPRVKEELERELLSVDNSASLDFADKYVGLIYDRPSSLVSYFSGAICVRDSTGCFERLRASRELLEETVKDLVMSGELDGAYAGAEWIAELSVLTDRMKKMPSFFADIFTRSYPEIAIGEIFDFSSQSRFAYDSNASDLLEDLAAFNTDGNMNVIFCDGEQEKKNLYKILFDAGLFPADADNPESRPDGADIGGMFYSDKNAKQPVAVFNGTFPSGFYMPKARLSVFDFSSETVASRAKIRMAAKRHKRRGAEAITSYHDLVPGDFVVHEVYGIGLYEGIENLKIDGVSRDYVHIRYAGKDKLFLPVDQLDLVSKYIGNADGGVKLSKMGGSDWTRSKAKAKSAAKDMAKELIELYARRKRTNGISFDPDDAMSAEFADAFEYEETDSQEAAIKDVSNDMERHWPMDRIVCGDVGYGKTEIAMRAAFKAVSSGYQVALLVPTTILAYQHYQTFLSRFRGFPVSIDMLSRFRTPAQRSASLRKLKRGETDIIIGTHRLISNDVEFSRLGLIIVDEEQRFGVAQKEKLKKLAIGADVLTLTATPIPRTLNMAIGGILDLSILDDVPGVRSPVQTYVFEHDDAILYEAIRRELRRGGQVFYLHNRIESIYSVAHRIEQAIPDARVAVGHGRLDRSEIEDIWTSLVKGEIDVLVSTTIIETGVDVPNANTLIIDNADRYGLAQLHQIRGRVGRSSRKAYAYFTYPRTKILSEVAEKRLRAIKEYASFGAGFKIAMRDMEIRGAGNLLGAEQHGHIESVGYDMYLKLLAEAVLEEEGRPVEKPRECQVAIRTDAFISKRYVSDSGQRMEMYKKIARISCEEDYDDVIDEFCDRFGDIPTETLSLCTISLIRARGERCGLSKIEQKEREISLYPESPDPFMLTHIMARYEKGEGQLRLSGVCSLTFKIPKGARAVDCADRITKIYCDAYNEYIEKNNDKDEGTEEVTE